MLMVFNFLGARREKKPPFRSYGGVHPADMKAPANEAAISTIAPPPQLVIPLSQHIGAPCAALVAVGDEVKMGQKIGEAKAPVSAPVHSSVSGKVIAIEPRRNSLGNMVPCVIIENDFQDTPAEGMSPASAEAMEDPEQLAAIIREAGIVGMGGATFPTAFKITSGWGKVDTVIINGAECEPYITSDHRTMLEHPEELLRGIQFIMKACKVDKAYFAIEKNKQFAIDLLNFKGAADMGIEIIPLETRYPQGAEKTLIHTITGREVPPGGLPAAVGCAVFNTFTSYSVYRAVCEGRPAIDRVVTVSGSAIAEPKNVIVRVGTPMAWVFEQTGGFAKEPWKIIMGGPMMGMAQFDLNVPCAKGTASLLAFAEKEDRTVAEPVCIRCGKCLEVCPVKLQPLYMYLYEEKGDVEMMKKLNLTDCVECGACTYNCPGRLHLTHAFKVGKAKIQAHDAAVKARAEAEAAKQQAEADAAAQAEADAKAKAEAAKAEAEKEAKEAAEAQAKAEAEAAAAAQAAKEAAEREAREAEEAAAAAKAAEEAAQAAAEAAAKEAAEAAQAQAAVEEAVAAVPASTEATVAQIVAEEEAKAEAAEATEAPAEEPEAPVEEPVEEAPIAEEETPVEEAAEDAAEENEEKEAE